MMMAKKQLVHASAAHSGHMKLSKSMLEKLARKRSPQKADEVSHEHDIGNTCSILHHHD